jgi:transcriptional regulator with XRE-family HTH domain
MPAHDGQHGEPREDLEALLRDLRALRARKGLSIAELAARTPFSQDTIAAAADGPDRPTMTVLEAYVRGCGDSLEGWKDRWQDLAPAADGPETLPQGAISGSTSQPGFTITRLGTRPAPWRLIRRGAAAGRGGLLRVAAGLPTAVTAAPSGPWTRTATRRARPP